MHHKHVPAIVRLGAALQAPVLALSAYEGYGSAVKSSSPNPASWTHGQMLMMDCDWGAAGGERDEMLQMGKAHLDSLELQRKAYVKARAFAMAQRSGLYARDELEMSVMRIRIRHPHEVVAPHEEGTFKLHPPEVPVRNKVGSICCLPSCCKFCHLISGRCMFQMVQACARCRKQHCHHFQ